MTGDPLYEPLGTAPPATPRGSRRWAAPVAGVVTMAIVVAGWVVAHRSLRPDGAVAVATIQPAPPVAVPPAATATPDQAGSVAVVKAAPPASQPGSTVEVQNGVKIIRFNPAASSASVTVPVDRDATGLLATGPSATGPLAAAPDPRVSEQTPAGLLPRIASDGTRAAEVYARPAVATSGPRVALLVVGMGLDQMATADASRRVPPDVSFGFAGTVADVAAQVSETRRAGHEVFLDLSVHATAGASEGVTAAMGGFAGYAGVVTPAGTAGAITQAVTARGVLDVTASPGPLPAGAGRIAVIDTAAGSDAVGAAIGKLIATARDKGSALGILTQANGLAGALDGVSARAAAQGVTLVPASSLLRIPGPGVPPGP